MAIAFTEFLSMIATALSNKQGANLAYLLRPTSPHGKDLLRQFRDPTVSTDRVQLSLKHAHWGFHHSEQDCRQDMKAASRHLGMKLQYLTCWSCLQLQRTNRSMRTGSRSRLSSVHSCCEPISVGLSWTFRVQGVLSILHVKQWLDIASTVCNIAGP